MQENEKAIERAIEILRQEYQLYDAKISDTMRQVSEDENKSSRSS